MQKVAIGGSQRDWREEKDKTGWLLSTLLTCVHIRQKDRQRERDRGVGGGGRTRFQGCCLDGRIGQASPGVTLHGADVFLAAPILGPSCLAVCRSFPLRLVHLVIRFPHPPPACHLAYPISRFPSLGPQHHPACSLLVSPHADTWWSTSYTHTYAPRSRPQPATLAVVHRPSSISIAWCTWVLRSQSP